MIGRCIKLNGETCEQVHSMELLGCSTRFKLLQSSLMGTLWPALLLLQSQQFRFFPSECTKIKKNLTTSEASRDC